MRTVLFYFLFLLLGAGCPAIVSAQQVPKPPKVKAERPLPGDGDDVPPPAPGALFVGEWEWRSGNEVLHITLTRDSASQDPRDPQHRVINVVMGRHRYTRNGVLIEQSSVTGPRPYTLFCVPADNVSMRMSFHDVSKDKWGRATLTLVPGNPTQLIWDLKPTEMIYVYPDVAPSPGFTVPTNVTLTRVP